MKLAAILAGGVALRLWIVLTTDGSTFDLDNGAIVLDALRAGGLDVYGLTSRSEWPYGPGYFGVVWLAGNVEGGGLDFREAYRLWPVVADTLLAVFVYHLAGRERLLAAAAVAFGPVFVQVSAWNGQLDPTVALLAVAAYWVWTRPGQRARGAVAGVLVGIAAAVKTVPLLLVLPFAASARTRREGAVVAGAAVAVLALALLPFWLATPDEVVAIKDYRSLPGFGGISLLLVPSFSAHITSGSEYTGGLGLLEFLASDATPFVLGPALVALAFLLFRREVDTLTGICLTWLVVYVFGVNFLVSYLVWALPFLLIRGHVRGVIAVQIVLAPLTLAVAGAFELSLAAAWIVYTGVMAGLWVFGAALLGRWTARLV